MAGFALDVAHVLAGGLVLLSFVLLYQDRLYALLNTFALHAAVLALAVGWQAYVQDAPHLFITAGIALKSPEEQSEIMGRVFEFSDFAEDNDPHGEHDFGAFDVFGERIFWKIDYYDLDMNHGSPDPADPMVTTRVLTILLADEY